MPTLATSKPTSASHHRRRSSIAPSLSPNIAAAHHSPASDTYATTSGLTSGGRFGQHLPTVPATPGIPDMSLSRSPSPSRGGGWASPGLTTPYNSSSRQPSPNRVYANGSANNVTWATAQARSAEVRGYPAFEPRRQGFARHFQLPYFGSSGYADKEKLGRGRWSGGGSMRAKDIPAFLGRIVWRLRARLAIVLGMVLLVILFYATRMSVHYWYLGSS